MEQDSGRQQEIYLLAISSFFFITSSLSTSTFLTCKKKKSKPFYNEEHEINRKSALVWAKLTHTAEVYPGFLSVKPTRSFATPPGRNASPSQVIPGRHFCQVALNVHQCPFIYLFILLLLLLLFF